MACDCLDQPRSFVAPSASTTAASASVPLAPEIQRDIEKLVASKAAAARAAKGTITVTRAWRYAGGPALRGQRAWVALDVDLRGQAIQAIDLEVVDEGGAVSPIGDLRRLDAEGQLTSMSGAHENKSRYLAFFDVASSASALSLRYWGETLTAAPFVVAPTGPTFAEANREVVRHFADGDRHVLVFEDQNQERPPSDLMIRVGFDGGRCAMRGMIPVDPLLAPAEPSVEPVIFHALYAADYRCAKPPTTTDAWRGQRPLPPAEPLALPAATLAALEGTGPDIVVVPTTEPFTAVAARADGSLVAIARRRQDIMLVDPMGKEVGRLPGVSREIRRLGFTPDGERLWAVEDAGDVVVWEVAKQTRVASRRLDPEPDLHAHAELAPSGHLLAVDHPWNAKDEIRVGWSGQVTLLTLPGLVPSANLKLTIGMQGSIGALAFSPDGRRLVACATTTHDREVGESIIRVHGVPRGEALLTLREPGVDATACAFADDGRLLVGTKAGDLVVYDAAGKKLSTQSASRGGVYAVAALPNGTLLTGGADGIVLAWPDHAAAPRRLFQHKFPVLRLAVARKWIVSTSSYEVAVIDEAGKLVKRLYGSPDGPHSVAAVAGLVVVAESAILGGVGRVRIWRGPLP